VAIGRMFFGESMFARVTDASKVALVHLVEMLKRRGMPLIDCQQDTAHLARLGARPISRKSFADEVERLVHSTAPAGVWRAMPYND
jgi:leucyl/phenylalanyl-tRNA--protein transferase